MRRRLALVALATTSMVVVAFLVPLFLLVRSQAEDRALRRAERDAQTAATAIALSAPDGDPSAVAAVLDAFGLPGVSVIAPDGTVVGPPVPDDGLVERAREGAAFTAALAGGGAAVVIPVVGPVPVVTRVDVPASELRSGVGAAWTALASLGVFLIGLSVLVADRLARRIVSPVGDLVTAARRLGEGELETRVAPAGPPEIAEVGTAFNHLAGRLDHLLRQEREAAADLSHRLRTPLTALRLQIGAVPDRTARTELAHEMDRLENAVTRMIEETRRPTTDSRRVVDLAAVVRHRAAFWAVLAEDQARELDISVPDGEALAAVSAEEAGTLVDTLVENVFAHTPPGTGMSLTVDVVGDQVTLTCRDEGPGFPLEAADRGASGSGSTGLGLDIVRRIARRSSGSVTIGDPGAGGVVVVRLGSAATADGPKP